MEAQLKRLITIEEFQTFINLPENSEKIFGLIIEGIMDIYNRALQDWSGGDGSFQLDEIRFMIMSAYYMDAEDYGLDLDTEGVEMLLRGALEHDHEVDYWWRKLETASRRRVCQHAFRTGDTPTRIRALYRMETLPDSDPPEFPEFLTQIFQTEDDEEMRVAALRVLGVRARMKAVREKYRIGTQYRDRLLLRITRQTRKLDTPESWKEVVFTPEIDLLVSSIALNQAMPRISEEAARVIGRIQSITALRPIVEEQKRGKRGALRALTFVRDESPNLPSFMSKRDRRYVWFANTARRLFDNPWGLFFRFTAALLGGWIGMGYHIFMTYRAQGFFATQKWVNALALGLMFGLVLALLVVFSGEFSERLRGFWPRWLNLIVSAGLGLAFGIMLWVQYHWLFLSSAAINLYWPSIILGGIGVAAGIVATAYFALPSLPAVIITSVTTYLPILYTWNDYQNSFDFSQNPQTKPLLYYFDDPSEVYSVAIPMAIVIAVGTHLPRLWRDMSQVTFPRITRRQTLFDHSENAAGVSSEKAPKSPLASETTVRILVSIAMYLQSNDIGRVTGGDGRYSINDQVYTPDIAFISYERQPEITVRAFIPNPPELAVEIISNPDSSKEQNTMHRKIANYLAAGTVVWVVNPETRVVEIHQPDTPVQEYDESAMIEGGDMLPGFKLPVKEIFPPKRTEKRSD